MFFNALHIKIFDKVSIWKSSRTDTVLATVIGVRVLTVVAIGYINSASGSPNVGRA